MSEFIVYFSNNRNLNYIFADKTITNMYRFFRNILFMFSPESVHHFTVNAIKFIGFIPFTSSIIRSLFIVKSKKLERRVFGITFKNPVGLAAGFDKNAEIYNEFSDFGFGFIELGTVTRKPQEGNKKPRLFRVVQDKAIINRMGFNNNGAKKMVEKLRKKRRKGLIIGGNIGKNSDVGNNDAVQEYEKTFTSLYNYVDYFVINISCPNVQNLTDLQNKDFLSDLLLQMTNFRQYRDIYKPILIKISSDLNFEQIDEMIDIINEFGIDGIVATNTTTSRDKLTINQKEIDTIGNGGLSGAPLTKRSIEIVSYINKKTQGNLPIIGVGGIMTEDDAVNMLKAGAKLIQIYTGFIYNGPKFVKRINKRIIKENL